MNHKFEMLSPVPGYQEPAQFMKVANFFGSDAYKKRIGKIIQIDLVKSI